MCIRDRKLQGVRLRRLSNKRFERDIYALNGYDPANEAGHAPKGVEAMEHREKHLEARDLFWQVRRRAVGQAPARASLIVALDANARAPPMLPWVGSLVREGMAQRSTPTATR
eukprot:7308106-Pyramimonas_sp.AAC.1